MALRLSKAGVLPRWRVCRALRCAGTMPQWTVRGRQPWNLLFTKLQSEFRLPQSVLVRARQACLLLVLVGRDRAACASLVRIVLCCYRSRAQGELGTDFSLGHLVPRSHRGWVGPPTPSLLAARSQRVGPVRGDEMQQEGTKTRRGCLLDTNRSPVVVAPIAARSAKNTSILRVFVPFCCIPTFPRKRTTRTTALSRR